MITTDRTTARRGALVTPIGKVLVTGGGGAIGSNVTDELVLAGAEEIVVLDNFVRGRRENLDWARANGNVSSSRATSATARSCAS